jgi:hypothetical protein
MSDENDITAPFAIRAGTITVGAVSPWSNPGHWLLPQQPPNLWRRFWTWALLGWRWERL